MLAGAAECGALLFFIKFKRFGARIMLKVGDKAPPFTLPAADGKNISLSDFRGKKVVLYFYPKDDTPGCTKEACSFQDQSESIRRRGAVVVGISADSIASHDKFRRKYSLRFPLLSDEEKVVVKAYGVWKKKFQFGKLFSGIKRTTFVIDERGYVTHCFPRVRVKGHVAEILEALAS